MLKDHPRLKKIHLCLDHDIAGMKGAERIRERLSEAGYLEVNSELSMWKDWNEDIKAMHGKEAIPAEEKRSLEMISVLV